MRVSRAEHEAVRRRAHSLGITPSAWFRAVLRDALDSRRDEVRSITAQASQPRQSPLVAEAVGQLRRVGVNLNQALRRGSAVDGDLLLEVKASVDSLRRELGDTTR
ncbi:hypothetical protein GZ997_01380 [Actinomyces sp. 565]|nr:hypothetical protein [Actinomyces sp. 565]